ncbi:MAG: 2OG-Fe(II) oxygenase [Thiotrichales bacterium]
MEALLEHEGFTPLYDDLADAIARDGYAVRTTVLSETLTLALLADALALETDAFTVAGVGRDRLLDHRIRLDRIHWLNHDRPAPTAYLAWAEGLRLALNQRLFLGLFDYESHYACYPVGAYYARHRDAFAGNNSRVLTTVLYLNTNWQDNDGGQLVLYDDDAEIARVSPTLGTLAVFLSERFPHEVIATRRRRYSVAGWFRRRGD